MGGEISIAITGIMGFIGHNIAEHLASTGYHVVGIDNFSRPSPRAKSIIEKLGIPVYKADVRHIDEVSRILGDVDTVIHTAALVSVSESMRNPLLYASNNVDGTVAVLHASLKAGVKRIIYLSSASVYGEPEHLPIHEDHPLRPLSPYGASKLAGEVYVEAFRRAYGRPNYIILRLFNVYGPGQDPSSPYSGVISRFVFNVCRGEAPIIYGDGKQTRDFIHVRDVARAIELAVNTSMVDETYNIGSGTPTSIEKLAYIILRLAGIDAEPQYSLPRPGDIRDSYANIEKASRLLGFKPAVRLEEGLAGLLQDCCVNARSLSP